MTRTLLIALSLLMLTGCGIQRPLMMPKDIPAYEEKQRRKQERLEQDMAPAQPATATQATE